MARVPALLCLDDVHVAQADEAWLGVLRHLARSPVRLLLLSREEPPLAGLAQIRALRKRQAAFRGALGQ